MRILHVIGNLNVGGAEKMLTELLPAQKKLGHDISIIILGTYDSFLVESLEKNSINIILSSRKKLYSLYNIFFLRKYASKYDIVHVHLFPSLYYGIFLKLFGSQLTLIYTEHNTHNKRRNKPIFKYIERIIYSQYTRIVSISDETDCCLKRWLYGNNLSKEDEARFSIIHNGIDITKYQRLPRIRENSETEKIIMMVSRFSKQKDQGTLIKAFSLLEPQKNNLQLVFVGDGDYRKSMEDLSKELVVEKYTFFLGTREDIPELMSTAYIGIQSSFWEGFGLTAVEFMAAGVPLIASDVKGLSSVVKDAGILFRTGDYMQLSNILKDLINDRFLYSSLVNAGLKRCEQYSIEKTAQDYIYTYKLL